MTWLSLRLRLALAGAAAIGVALALAAFGLAALFERHVERRALAELGAHHDQLVGALARDAEGRLVPTHALADPRFVRPLSGLYWQVGSDAAAARSRSLWDAVLPLPDDALLDGATHAHDVAGPGSTTLLALERRITLPPRLGGDAVRVAVAMDRAEIDAARNAFLRDLTPALALLALVLAAAGWAQLAIGLRPLNEIGTRVAAIRSGTATRIGEALPQEVRPLAMEVDTLLEERAAELTRAQARAADLAHGLKTPLQALLGEAERLRAWGEADAAAGIEAVGETMRRHVERELARARTKARTARQVSMPHEVSARVLSVIGRTPQGAALDLRNTIPVDAVAQMDAADLAEALGALIENAARHARTCVTVSARREGAMLALSVSDDGPGAPPETLDRLAERGTRLDEAGTGLGLAIARQIIEAVGGHMTITNRPEGGFVATLTVVSAN